MTLAQDRQDFGLRKHIHLAKQNHGQIEWSAEGCVANIIRDKLTP